MLYKLEFVTFYNQFYICDANSPLNTVDDFWNDEADTSRLAVSLGIVGITIKNEELARVSIDICENPKFSSESESADHIVEGGLNLNSGKLQVRACPDSRIELDINVNPGLYRLRVCSFDLENEDRDRYNIVIWPDKNQERKVLKHFYRE